MQSYDPDHGLITNVMLCYIRNDKATKKKTLHTVQSELISILTPIKLTLKFGYNNSGTEITQRD